MTNKQKKFIMWLNLHGICALGIFFGVRDGIIQTVLNGDATKIVYGIVAMYILISLYIGIGLLRKRPFSLHLINKIPDISVTLGLLGTFIGFGIMLNTNFSVTAGDQEAIKTILVGMSTGMSTALYTSIVGLIVSILTKIQIHLVEMSL